MTTTRPAIVFDLDGTLVDSFRDIAAALNDVLRALSRPTHEPDRVKSMIGDGVHVLLERGLGSGDPQLVERGRTLFKDAYRTRLTETTKPYPGILEALAELRGAGFSLSIATNKPSMFTDPLVRALGLLEAGIDGIASADEAGARKPSPRVVQLALERSRVLFDAEKTIYVGDMPVDHATTRVMGIPLAGVGWGFDPSSLAKLEPELWVEDTRALAPSIIRYFDGAG